MNNKMNKTSKLNKMYKQGLINAWGIKVEVAQIDWLIVLRIKIHYSLRDKQDQMKVIKECHRVD